MAFGHQHARSAATAAALAALLGTLALAPSAAQSQANPSQTTESAASTILLDFAARDLDGVEAQPLTTVDWVEDGQTPGAGSLRMHFKSSDAASTFPAVVIGKAALATTEFSRFEAMGLSLFNPGDQPAQVSLCILDDEAFRAFPVPSTIEIPPGKWHQIVVRMPLAGIQAGRIDSLHFFQKPGRPACTLLIDQVLLLTPYDGRIAAKIQSSRELLDQARGGAAALGVTRQMEARIAELEALLEALERQSQASLSTGEKTRRLLQLAQATTAASQLAESISIRNNGANVTLAGPHVDASWLADAEKVAGITTLRLMDTPISDEDFSRLTAARNLERLIVRGQHFTGAGLAHVPPDKLRRLTLSSTAAHDGSLAAIGRFQQLQELELAQTNVTSRFLEHLAPLDELQSLNLNDTGVSDAGLEHLRSLAGLESLELARTSITGDSLQHLAALERLKSLDLSDTSIDDEGLAHLAPLSRLESLQLANTPITGAGFARLESLDNLVVLNLSGTRVGDSALRQLGRLPLLKRLELSSTPITDASVGHVAASASLEYLDLYGTAVTDAAMAHLAAQDDLSNLYLAATGISDAGAAYLAGLGKLERLDLEGTRITDAGLAHLAGLSHLATLRLGGTRVVGTGLAHLAGLSKLGELDLSGTDVNDQSLAPLASLENLRVLNLAGTRITGLGMQQLAPAAQLASLNLEATRLDDKGLEALAGLQNLQDLNLAGTAITDEGLKHLAAIKPLQSLALNHTRITDDGLAQLKDGFTALELTHTRITDQGVAHLARNDQLTHLRLASTLITSDALGSLQALPNLRHLDLSETNITDDGLLHLAVLPNLSELRLDATPITDIALDTLLEMPALERLSLENTRVTAQGASYARHRAARLELGLVFPWVWGERWSTYSIAADWQPARTESAASPLMQQLKALSSLGYLHLHDDLLTRDVLRSLKDLPALEHLSFRDTSITDDQLADLLGLSRIARIDLSGTRVTDAGLIHLKDMQQLRELNLAGTRVTGQGLADLVHLERLASLNLARTPLDDAGLAHVARFRQLRKLELGNTRLTDHAVRYLARPPRLQYLDLYATALTDQGVAQLARIPSLRYLYLSHTALTDAALADLAHLTDLQELGLDGTGVTDDGLPALRSLIHLKRLKIGRTAVTDAGLAHLAVLPSLQELQLNRLGITDQGVASLASLPALRSLDLSGTRITSAALPVLGSFSLLAQLNIRDTAVAPRSLARFARRHPDMQLSTGTSQRGYSAAAIALAALYGAAAAAIALYGLHRYWLGWLFLSDRQALELREPPDRFEQLPVITVQLPMFNERQVASRIIAAACSLNYPRQSLQIQVLDDSTDQTPGIARRQTRRMAAEGHDIQYIHRPRRDGFKGGALAEGLQTARGEFVAVFDADFIPPPDLLQQLVHHFTNPQVGMVQAAWTHLNRHESLLTECQAMFLDGHFVVEQTARSRNARWFNFNGTAGMWRKECVVRSGGWQHDTLTEDTDLSYRAQLQGWKFVYLPDVRCGAELPSTMTAFLGQQHRWTKGLIQTAKKLLGPILRSSAPWRTKVEACFHLTSPIMYLVMFLVTAIALPALFIATPLAHYNALSLAIGLATLTLGTFGACGFYIISQRAQGFRLVPTIFKLPLLLALGIGVCATGARAVVEALLGFKSPFVRTPKFGGRADCDPDPAARRPWRLPAGLVELVLAGLLLACLVLSFVRPYTLVGAPFLLLFALGYLAVGWASLVDHLHRRAVQARPAAARWRWPSIARYAAAAAAVSLMVCVSAAALLASSRSQGWQAVGDLPAMSLGVDLSTARWRIQGGQPSQPPARGAIRQLHIDRGSLVLDINLDQDHDQGEIVLDLDSVLQPLGDTLGPERQLTFEVQYPARFTGELQAFVKDRDGKSQYGSIQFVEARDPRSSVTVPLVPSSRLPAMGYQDDGFDPHQGMRQIGLKVSAQSDRVRGAGYRPFRGTIEIAEIRVSDADPALHPPPQLRPVLPEDLHPLAPVSQSRFTAVSGLDRPWPLGYAFSGPLEPSHVDELDRTYERIASGGYGFTRVYLGDYRTGLLVDGQGRITGVEPAFVDYIDRLAELANRHGITVMFSLTDNTMADGRGVERLDLIRQGDQSDRFIKHVLTRFVRRLDGRRVIWDVFNEPENTTALPLLHVQQYVDRVLAALRSADPDARLTVVSRGRDEVIYWQGRGLDLYTHNIFTIRSLRQALDAPRKLDAPIMVAEMAPQLATPDNLDDLRRAGYSGAGVWGWSTQDKYQQHFERAFLNR